MFARLTVAAAAAVAVQAAHLTPEAVRAPRRAASLRSRVPPASSRC